MSKSVDDTLAALVAELRKAGVGAYELRQGAKCPRLHWTQGSGGRSIGISAKSTNDRRSMKNTVAQLRRMLAEAPAHGLPAK